MVSKKEKLPLPRALKSFGAAYRIRTYDVLIRSQTLYPAEVTPPVQEPLSGLPDNLVRRIGFEPMTF